MKQEYGQTLIEKWEKKLEAALKIRDHKLRDLEEEVASLAKKLQAAVETVEAVEKTNRLPLQGEFNCDEREDQHTASAG